MVVVHSENPNRKAEWARFAQCYDPIDALIVILDEHGCMEFLNEHGRKLLQRNKNQICGVSWPNECVADADRTEARVTFLEALYAPAEHDVRGSYHVVMSNGDTKRIAWRAHPLKRENGSPAGVLISATEDREEYSAGSPQHDSEEMLSVIRRIDKMMASTVPLEFTLEHIEQELVSHFDIDAVCILTLSEPDHRLHSRAEVGFRNDGMRNRAIRPEEGLIGQAVRERRTVTCHDIQTEESSRLELFRQEGFHGYVCVPLTAKAQRLGTLEVFRRHLGVPSKDEMALLESFAEQVAVAIDSNHSYLDLQSSQEQLRMAYDETIEGWSRALDYRDHGTEGHSQRVTDLAIRLARQAGFSEDMLKYVRWGALLHDVGKLGVPDAILHKKGKLTDEEWEVMRQHPVIARNLLKPIAYLQPAIPIPYHHHEWWDGTGYPSGMAGEDIPLAARIFAVTDVWDALRSDRTYRKAWSEADTLHHLKVEAGSHFDPEIIELFLRSIEEQTDLPMLRLG